MKKNKFLFRKIFCFIFILVFSFSCFMACSAPGSSATGGSGGGGSSGTGGSSSGGGSSGGGSGGGSSGGGSSLSEEEIAAIGNPDLDFSSLYSGAYLLIKANANTLFYDDATEENKSFKFLVDRQLQTIVEEIVYALEVVYGGDVKTQNTLSTFPVSVQDFKVIGTATSKTEKCKIHTGNNICIDCSECLARIAGLRGAFDNNPFNFNNAILGGYQYDEEQVAFTSTIINTNKWIAGPNISITKIKEAIAKILATGDSTSSISYEDALLTIDHLGFTKSIQIEDKFTTSEQQLIIDYILSYVIGSKNVQADNVIKTSLGGKNAIIQVSDTGVELFSGNTSKHHYKAYTDVVNYVVEKALALGSDGTFKNSDGVFDSDAKTLFPEMPRVTIKYYSSEYFRENVEGKTYYDASDMEDWDEDEWADYEEQTGGEAVYYNIMKNNQNIISMILLPQMEDSVFEENKEYLKDLYGEDFVNSWDELGYIYADGLAFGVNGSKTGSNCIIKPKFYIKAQGEVILDDYVKNLYYQEVKEGVDQPADKVFQKSENEIYVQFHNSVSDSEINDYNAVTYYDLNAAQEEAETKKRMAPYDGLPLVIDNLYNPLYFVSGKQKVWADLFHVEPKYDAENLEKFVPGVNSTFKGGNNFLQINFEYYDESGNVIDAQPINFFYFNGFA